MNTVKGSFQKLNLKPRPVGVNHNVVDLNQKATRDQPSCLHKGAYGTVTSLDDDRVVKIYDTDHWHNIEPFKNTKMDKQTVRLALQLPTLDFDNLDHWIESHEPYLLQPFLIELLCLIKLSGHPHIARMIDFDIEDQKMSIIMQREAHDLESWVRQARRDASTKKNTPIHQLFDSPTRVFETIAMSIFQGLDAMHQVGIVHGDMKPNNILINPETWLAKICDFSLSNIQMAGIDQQYNMTMIRFQSPEQMCGLGWDHKSDVWAAALVLIGFWLPGDRRFDWTPHLTESHGKAINDILDRVAPLFKLSVEDQIMDERRQDALIEYHARLCAVHDKYLGILIDFVPNDYKPLFVGMLNTNRHERWSAQQCLDAMIDMIMLDQPIESTRNYMSDKDAHHVRLASKSKSRRWNTNPQVAQLDKHPNHHDQRLFDHQKDRLNNMAASSLASQTIMTRPEDRSDIHSMVMSSKRHLVHDRIQLKHNFNTLPLVDDHDDLSGSNSWFKQPLVRQHQSYALLDDQDDRVDQTHQSSSSHLQTHANVGEFSQLQPLWFRPKLSDDKTISNLLSKGPHPKYIWAPLEQFAHHRIHRWIPSARLGHIPLIDHWFPPTQRACFLPGQSHVSLNVYAQAVAELNIWKHFLRTHADWVFEHDQAYDNLWSPILYQLMSMPLDQKKYHGLYKMMQTIWSHWHTPYHDMTISDQIRLGLIIFYSIAAALLLMRMTHERLSLKDLITVYWSVRRRDPIGAVAIRLWDTYQFKLTNHAFYDILQHYIARLLSPPPLE